MAEAEARKGRGGEAFKAGLGLPLPAWAIRALGRWIVTAFGKHFPDALCRVACGEAREMPLVWAEVEEVAVLVGGWKCGGGVVNGVVRSVGRVRTEGPRDLLPAA